MRGTSDRGSKWVHGWLVYRDNGWRRKFVGVFDTRQEALAEAEKAGKGYEVRFGSYNESAHDFTTAGQFEQI
jgi:hypothetical protein